MWREQYHQSGRGAGCAATASRGVRVGPPARLLPTTTTWSLSRPNRSNASGPGHPAGRSTAARAEPLPVASAPQSAATFALLDPQVAKFRAYDPASGRWLSRDPIGERAGLNVYAYVGNSPIDAKDPLGLCSYFAGGSNLPKDYGHLGAGVDFYNADGVKIGILIVDYMTSGMGSGPGIFGDMFAPGTVKFTLAPIGSPRYNSFLAHAHVIQGSAAADGNLQNWFMNTIAPEDQLKLAAAMMAGGAFELGFPGRGVWKNYTFPGNNCGHFSIRAAESYTDQDIMPTVRNKGSTGQKPMTPQMAMDAITGRAGQ